MPYRKRRSVRKNNNRSANKNNRSANNNKKSLRRSKRVASRKPAVGTLSAQKATFAAKLGAFMCENEKLSDVVATPERGFDSTKNGRSVNKRVFGVLPFLHMNITKPQFMAMLNNSSKSMKNDTQRLCMSNRLETKLKAVKFNCPKQSAVGNAAFIRSICESIENRWEMRKNGRAVLNKIEAVQRKQQQMGIIPAPSLRWCGGL